MPYFINEYNNLLFIHIPKTGGTSLDLYFSKKYNILLNNNSLYGYCSLYSKSTLQHLTYNNIIENNNIFRINIEDIKNIITIVRNPYHRIMSDLFFCGKINATSSKDHIYNIMKEHIIKNPDNHTLPQYLFITDSEGKLLDNIKILYTETLNNDMVNLGYTDFNLFENYNIFNTHNRLYESLFNKDSIDLINSYYDKDFFYFNYEKM